MKVYLVMYAIDSQVYFKNQDGFKAVMPVEEWHKMGDPNAITISTDLG